MFQYPFSLSKSLFSFATSTRLNVILLVIILRLALPFIAFSSTKSVPLPLTIIAPLPDKAVSLCTNVLNSNIPTFDALLIPTIQAIQQLGGSGSNQEINGKVYEIAKIPNDISEIPHGEDGTMSEVDYRLAWSKTYLKKYGLL